MTKGLVREAKSKKPLSLTRNTYSSTGNILRSSTRNSDNTVGRGQVIIPTPTNKGSYHTRQESAGSHGSSRRVALRAARTDNFQAFHKFGSEV